MEIPVADQYVQPIVDNADCDHGLAFLSPLAPYRGNKNKCIMFIKEYISDVYRAVSSLLKGMKTTGSYFIRPKEIITQQYPDNRAQMKLPERFRGEVVMPHDENNEHACTGCTACELACPNATIKIITKFDTTPEGKKKKALDTFVYHLELCTMCNLCVEACPTSAIKMGQQFEHSVYDRNQLLKKLNQPGSKLRAGIE
jgi:NADH-quinone oxidoreductase subunit I